MSPTTTTLVDTRRETVSVLSDVLRDIGLIKRDLLLRTDLSDRRVKDIATHERECGRRSTQTT